MDSIQASNCGGSIEKEKELVNNTHTSMVDPFLVEALQNPRHRLTILRMELDIQKFLQNPQQLQFEFQHFPTSYLRLAAHRVAQHYGLQTMALDNLVDGPGTKIMVIKTAETKCPSVCLSDITAKQSENSKQEQVKIAIRPRPSRASSVDGSYLGIKHNPVRSVEERKEEYDKARARIFSSPNSLSSDETSQVATDGKGLSPSKDENEGCQNIISDSERIQIVRDIATSSRVAAIFKDREKDRTDPDYDRSYERYVKSFPAGHSLLPPFSVPKFQLPFVQYDTGFPGMGQIPRAQTSLNYGPSPNPSVNPYCTMGSNQASRDAIYMQWPSPTMMYAHSYEQLRHSVFQAPVFQQPLSFHHSQNH